MILHRARTAALVLAVTFIMCGCTVSRTHHVPPAQGLNKPAGVIVGITTISGQEVVFDRAGAQLRGDSLFARIRGTPFAIGVDQIRQVSVSRPDGKRSAVATFGGITATIGVPLFIPALLIWMSGGVG